MSVDSATLWPGLRFPAAEYEARRVRMLAAMQAHQLDALLVADERTLWYLVGIGSAVGGGSRSRPRVLLLGADGRARLHVHQAEARVAAEQVEPSIEIVPYRALSCAPLSALMDDLARARVGRLGAELSSELRPELTYQEWAALAAGDWRLVDASDAVWATRQRKSEAELERMRAAVDVTARAYKAAWRSVGVGVTEAEIAARMATALRASGAQAVKTACVTGQGDYWRSAGVPRVRPVQSGELIFVDVGACLGGYWSDFSRSAVAGEPSPEQVRAHALIRQVTEAGVAALRPDRPIARAAQEIAKALRAAGLPDNAPAGRYGHGLGLLSTEPPSLALDDPTVLEPGMVITVEPSSIAEHGIYHAEVEVLVTAEGPRLLSPPPAGLMRLT